MQRNRGNNRMGHLGISSRKLEISRKYFMQRQTHMDLKQAENTKKGWQEYTEELYKKQS